jgi:hypothetical protein
MGLDFANPGRNGPRKGDLPRHRSRLRLQEGPAVGQVVWRAPSGPSTSGERTGQSAAVPPPSSSPKSDGTGNGWGTPNYGPELAHQYLWYGVRGGRGSEQAPLRDPF